MPYSTRSRGWLVAGSLGGLFLQVFSVLSSAIEARSTGGTRVRSVGWLKRIGGGGGEFLTVVDGLLIRFYLKSSSCYYIFYYYSDRVYV